MPTYVWLKQNFHKRSLPVSQKCTLMFSILFYFFLFWKCQLQPTKFISWHVYWSWLSVWKTFYYPMWPLPSSLTLSSTLLLTLLQLQLLCLRYDMVTLALGLLHLAFSPLGTLFPCSLPISAGVLFKCFFFFYQRLSLTVPVPKFSIKLLIVAHMYYIIQSICIYMSLRLVRLWE